MLRIRCVPERERAVSRETRPREAIYSFRRPNSTRAPASALYPFNDGRVERLHQGWMQKVENVSDSETRSLNLATSLREIVSAPVVAVGMQSPTPTANIDCKS